MTRDVWASIDAKGIVSETVSYDIEAVEHGDGEVFTIEVTLDLGVLAATAGFPLEVAEKFLIELRDEIVRGKQAHLEWETDTDPSTGVTDAAAEGEDGGEGV